MHLFGVLRRPLVTEKNTAFGALGKYVFRVSGDANKNLVRDAVEKAFKVKVTQVNMITVRGKSRRFGRRMVAPHPWKKAVVTLAPGDKIEFFQGV